MARAIAVCTCAFCGKQFEKIAYKRNRAEANRWKEWAEANIDQCADCYHAAEAEKAATAAQEYGLPRLTGSPKQIAWAEQIRQKFWEQYLKYEKDAEEYSKKDGHTADFESGKVACREVFQTVTDSREYIDNRYTAYDEFLVERIERRRNSDGRA